MITLDIRRRKVEPKLELGAELLGTFRPIWPLSHDMEFEENSSS